MVALTGGVYTNQGIGSGPNLPGRTNATNLPYQDYWNQVAEMQNASGLYLQGEASRNIANGSFNHGQGFPPSTTGTLPTSYSGMSIGGTQPKLPPFQLSATSGPLTAQTPTAVANAEARTGNVDINIAAPKRQPILDILPSLMGMIAKDPQFTPPGVPNMPSPVFPGAPELRPIPGPNMPSPVSQIPAASPFAPGTGAGGGLPGTVAPPTQPTGVPNRQGGGPTFGGGGEMPRYGGKKVQAPGRDMSEGKQQPQQPPQAMQPPVPQGGPPGRPGAVPPQGPFMGNMPPVSSGRMSPQQMALMKAMKGEETPGMPITAQYRVQRRAQDDGYGDTASDTFNDGYGQQQPDQSYGGQQYPGFGNTPQRDAQGNPQYDAQGNQVMMSTDQVAQQIHNSIMQEAATLGPEARSFAADLPKQMLMAQAAAAGAFAEYLQAASDDVAGWQQRAERSQNDAIAVREGRIDMSRLAAAADQYARDTVKEEFLPQPPAEPKSLGQVLHFKARKGLMPEDPNAGDYGEALYDQRKWLAKERAAARQKFMENALAAPAKDAQFSLKQLQEARLRLNNLMTQQDRAMKNARMGVAQAAKAEFEQIKIRLRAAQMAGTQANAEQKNARSQDRIATGNVNAETGKRNAGAHELTAKTGAAKEDRITKEHGSDLYAKGKQSEITKNEAIARAADARAKKDSGGGSSLFKLVEPPEAKPVPEGTQIGPGMKAQTPKMAPEYGKVHDLRMSQQATKEPNGAVTEGERYSYNMTQIPTANGKTRLEGSKLPYKGGAPSKGEDARAYVRRMIDNGVSESDLRKLYQQHYATKTANNAR